jgi:hypothetical protein
VHPGRRVPLFHADGDDYLVLGSFLLSKSEQPAFADKANWREDYGLD